MYLLQFTLYSHEILMKERLYYGLLCNNVICFMSSFICPPIILFFKVLKKKSKIFFSVLLIHFTKYHIIQNNGLSPLLSLCFMENYVQMAQETDFNGEEIMFLDMACSSHCARWNKIHIVGVIFQAIAQ